MEALLNIALLSLMVVIAVGIARMRDLFGAVMLAASFSLVAATVFVLLDAVDVAFTEAAVGAGISTVLLLAALSVTGDRKTAAQKVDRGAILVTGLLALLLIWGTFDMPLYGDPEAPVHSHVTDRYLFESKKEVGLPNVVTSVLASYRGFDTLGETVVIFTAGIAVLMLLGGARRRDDSDHGER